MNGYSPNFLKFGSGDVAFKVVWAEASLASEIGILHFFVVSHLFQASPDNLPSLMDGGMGQQFCFRLA
jgi:hypothetical protein